ncbi:MAG: Glycerol-3-phosphate ABC transporter, substrate-binding protein UgpB [uncultured Caballeronia sp.]|nr:MAG: Glycerol-3-phosphate ABC transporter, substrate-binding protein UgpB [uncultured Caballeronia sp.]
MQVLLQRLEDGSPDFDAVQQLDADAKKLKVIGMCGYSSGWQSWIQLENYSA